MKILLIAPASGKWRKVGRSGLFKGRTFRFSLLSLLCVAAETPAGDEVLIVDEQIEDIPWDGDIDLVGITCMTAAAPRAYEISKRFRDRGVPVVLGGMHPTLCPDEARHESDAIVMGDAEGVWPRVVADARQGRLQNVYRADVLHNLRSLVPPPRHLLDKKRYATIHAVQATRGCPHGCGFCAVSAFHGQTHRRRPADQVAAEVASIPDRTFIFVDDNLTADREYCLDLFAALEPLGKRWISQSTLEIAHDPAFVRQAARAGCVGLFVGLETFSEGNLRGVNKTCNHVAQYRDAIRLLHSVGIAVEAGIVFGFEGDGRETFGATLRALDELCLDVVQVSIMTPLPGTPRFETMRERIVDEDWSHYDFHHAVFKPRGLTPAELQAGHDWVTRKFYSPWRTMRRLARHAVRPGGMRTLPYLAAVNFAYLGRVIRWKIKGWNPARRAEAAMPALALRHPAAAVVQGTALL